MTKRAERFVFSTSTKIFKPNMKQMNHNSPYAIVAHRSYRALVLVDFTKLTSCFTASLSVFFAFLSRPVCFVIPLFMCLAIFRIRLSPVRTHYRQRNFRSRCFAIAWPWTGSKILNFFCREDDLRCKPVGFVASKRGSMGIQSCDAGKNSLGLLKRKKMFSKFFIMRFTPFLI